MNRNSGMERAVKLTVTTEIAGTPVTGYPRTYHINDAFENYTSISDEELQIMYSEDYLQRLSAFKNYVESIEIGVIVNITEAYRENFDSCPIN